LNGDDIASALSKQIVHYNIHTSLFDIVVSEMFNSHAALIWFAECLLHLKEARYLGLCSDCSNKI